MKFDIWKYIDCQNAVYTEYNDDEEEKKKKIKINGVCSYDATHRIIPL